MAATQLNLPVDIPWRRLAFSTDMIDTNFGDLDLPPKWRSSLTAFFHLVPVEDTAENYPEGRLIYLRLSCSVTGFNPNEELRHAAGIGREDDAPDDDQFSTWQAILAEDWASTYWPCLGAIVQLAVYPHPTDTATPAGFPFIVDFEPKKRELYETRTDTGEVLSGSSEKLSVGKSNSQTDSSEKSHIVAGEVGVSIPGISATGSYQYTTKKASEANTVETRASDSARDRRETTSHSTTISQMYQLFNGYHLGTNRAVFSIAPRPHVVTDAKQAPFNLIRGRRLLEGLQDVFAVIYIPNELQGFAFQATLDTGHEVSFLENTAVMMKKNDLPDDVDPPGLPPNFPPDVLVAPPDAVLDPGISVSQLVVTRRVIRSAGLFHSERGVVLTPIPEPEPANAPAPSARIVFEALVHRPQATPALQAMARGTVPAGDRPFFADADQLNAAQFRVQAAMLRGLSAGFYRPRPLIETRTFRRLAVLALRKTKLPPRSVLGDARAAATLEKTAAKTVGELFTPPKTAWYMTRPAVKAEELTEARRVVLDKLLAPRRR